LYCGDTSSENFIKQLPDAKFAFADPPYNAGVADWDNSFAWQHDWLTEKAGIVAVTPGIISIFDFARITKMPYRWSMSCWIDNGMTRSPLGFGNWIYIALFSEDSNLHCNCQDIVRVSIKTNETGETKHKGRKPAEMMVNLLNMFTQEKDIVIDPFLGSGTTLLAAETTNRICYSGEISPEYCSEIIERWQHKTGKKAVKCNGKNALPA
jgi:hypothetical protein